MDTDVKDLVTSQKDLREKLKNLQQFVLEQYDGYCEWRFKRNLQNM
mgnify:CR=1 FL=1